LARLCGSELRRRSLTRRGPGTGRERWGCALRLARHDGRRERLSLGGT
jgi:hypothetical protein